MFYLNDLWPDGLIWLLFAMSVLSVFLRPQAWPILLSLTGLTAFFLERVSLTALAIILAGLLIAKLSQRQVGAGKILCHIMVIIWSVCFTIHLVSGFDNLLILDNALTGSNSIPFTMYLNLDKPLIIFGLLLLSPTMLSHTTASTRSQLAILGSLFVAVPLLAWATGIVEPELSMPDWIWVFIINNLLFTCVAEEALFRGYIQRGLCQRFSPTIGILTASILFGMAHFAGGILFILVATLAGILYGLTYYWSGKLAYAILIHFAFNLVHLMFFTYPMAI
ncbi:CPBP family intramembrane glutamic endopeptidase [Photobacterium rosenbergii]|uniref:CPBP family intramembrane glutamic endopeptidase n=1 Tax=Photobacterium rosenbergii TaxID=294936 RepID=UPI001C98EF25|nr:type II CAAX endopeptidase family protein [Photobacterium rosenbergii]MBY5946346.1 CPBP family intramembrane metalloprotease [Photobacterium rosenbergii]